VVGVFESRYKVVPLVEHGGKDDSVLLVPLGFASCPVTTNMPSRRGLVRIASSFSARECMKWKSGCWPGIQTSFAEVFFFGVAWPYLDIVNHCDQVVG
jgi:hypothetical protein